MRTTQQMSITLPNEMAEFVRTKVASGDYANGRDGTPIVKMSALHQGIPAHNPIERTLSIGARSSIELTCSGRWQYGSQAHAGARTVPA
ncbi:ribbon-helix-helix domain-containing protein [Caballeronia cordobensis]|uniref:ribbon-helix-helix domain-containing protein n=1 Tax=Caballeronia cordobensis TaxID=1353886 RepID=UPI00045EF271|nr:putative addiction module antidote protein, CC2985 family precursor [Burkholderia sp. RPE67]